MTSVFGLTVALDRAVAGLDPVREPGDPEVTVNLRAHLNAPAYRRSRCVERRRPNGSLDWAVDVDAAGNYELSGAHCGRHQVAADGRTVHSAIEDSDVEWQRLFLAQVLPLVTVLRGLEVFHASAVTFNGSALALVAPSGGGKSTVASALQERGAGFLTDDVLALEPGATGVLAHPGPALTWLQTGEGHGKALVEHTSRADAAPLRAVYFLGHATPGGDDIQDLAPADPRLLLASSFNFYMRSPERLTRQLDVCSRTAQTVGMFAVPHPRSAAWAQVAASVEQHFTRLLMEERA